MRGLDALLQTAGVTVRQGDIVLDVGCAHTPDLAVRAAHVVALHTSHEALRRARQLNNVTPVLGDGRSLAGVEDGSIDGAVADLRLPAAKRALSCVEDLGRVLRPGAWAAFLVNTSPAAEPAAGTSRRDLLRGLAGRRGPTRGAPVPLEALGAVATGAGLVLEDITGAGTARTVVRATRSPAS